MTEELNLVASRIKELREIFGFNEEKVAEKLSVSVDLYRKYESSGEDIPISALYILAGMYNVDMTDLLSGKSPKLNTLSVVKKGEGLWVERFAGYKYENIGFKFMHRKMEPFIVELNPGTERPEMVMHNGQEINFCIEGSMILYYDETEVILNKGDCAYFDPSHPHGQKCATNDGKAVFLTVIHE